MLPLALIAVPVVLGLIFWPIIGVLLVEVPGDLNHFFFKLLMTFHYLGVIGIVLFTLFSDNRQSTEELEILVKIGWGQTLILYAPHLLGQVAI